MASKKGKKSHSKKTKKKSSSHKKSTAKHSTHKRAHKAKDEKSQMEMQKALTENFIALQKIMTNLSVKFDNLTEDIGKLLNLFEISAKALAEKDLNSLSGSSDSEVMEKIDRILEQNKVIARGLTLLHGGEEETNPNLVQGPIENYQEQQEIPQQPPIQPALNPIPSRPLPPPRPPQMQMPPQQAQPQNQMPQQNQNTQQMQPGQSTQETSDTQGYTKSVMDVNETDDSSKPANPPFKQRAVQELDSRDKTLPRY